MLSVIIATQNSERPLVVTLASLVSGATEGLVGEVLIADGGSRDDTAAVADVAGCKFLRLEEALALRMRAAAGAARHRWLMFLRPGTVLDTPWAGETMRFVERPGSEQRAAIFRRGAPTETSLRLALSLLASALGTRPHPEQGLVIAKPLYETIGGHSESAADPELDLIRRIGRRRIARLSSSAVVAD